MGHRARTLAEGRGGRQQGRGDGRTGEIRSATGGEIDFDAAIWTVAAERTKAHREHRVPLTREALALLPRGEDKAALLFPTANGSR
jgi:integrase